MNIIAKLKSRIGLLIVILILVAFLPLTVFVSQQQQNLRQRAAEPAYRRVFVSSRLYNGDLGGVAGADSKCQDLANSAGLGGTWMAWISDNSSSPLTRFTKSAVPYKLVDGTTVIVNNWTDLVTNKNINIGNGEYLKSPILKNENGNTQSAASWTATNPDGTWISEQNNTACSNWTNNAKQVATIGNNGFSNATWTKSEIRFCDEPKSLYCFEQTDFSAPLPTVPPSPTPITTTTPAPSITPPVPSQTPTTSPTPAPRPLACGNYGDVDKSGDISQKDIDLLKRFLVDPTIFDDDQKRRANVSGDEKVGVADAIVLLRLYLVQTINVLPICTLNGDIDGNGHIDIRDFNSWRNGMRNPNLPNN